MNVNLNYTVIAECYIEIEAKTHVLLPWAVIL